MKVIPGNAFILPALALTLAGCNVISPARYYVSTQESPESTVTTIIDASSGAPFIEIAEFDDQSPAIRILPPPTPTGTPAGPNVTGSETVRIKSSSVGSIQLHAVGLEGPGMTLPVGVSNQDTNQDGLTDTRMVTFPVGAGFMIYHDFDADGVLDAYNRCEINGEQKTAHRAILFQEHWVAVGTDEATFSKRPRVATSVDSPYSQFVFENGEWQEIAPEGAAQ